MGNERVIGTSALNFPAQKEVPDKASFTNYSPKLLYQAAEFLCLPKSPDPHVYQWFIHLMQDQTPPPPLDKNLTLVKTIVQNPTIPAQALADKTNLTLEELIAHQAWIQDSNLLREVVTSHYYPGYLFMRYAQSFLGDLKQNPESLNIALNNGPVTPKRLEIHVTNASCNYRCEMCLWHVQNKGDYQAKEKQLKMLDTQSWKSILTQSKQSGTEVVIFSGGGEPLLRPDFSQVLDHALNLDLYTMVYTNGSTLANYFDLHPTYTSLLTSDWLRISLHATTEDKYASLVNLPASSKPLEQVVKGMERISRDRDRLGSPLKVGIGFVIQHSNYGQIEDVAKLAYNLGLDFLNLRVDCIDITEKLSSQQEEELVSDLQNVRDDFERGVYGRLIVDFADSLVSRMNGWDHQPAIEQTTQCFVHHYRPAIDPFGRFAICDLASEPYFSRDELTLGYIGANHSYREVLAEGGKKKFYTYDCKSCMPGQQAINALWQKVLLDYQAGVDPSKQPFLFNHK